MTEDTLNRPQGMAERKAPELAVIPDNPRYKGATPEMALLKAKRKPRPVGKKRGPSSI